MMNVSDEIRNQCASRRRCSVDRHPARERDRRVARRQAAAQRRAAAGVGLRRDHEDDRQDERDQRQLGRRVAQPVDQARARDRRPAREDEVADATALTVAISTAPAAMSFASLASGSNEVVATSIACSIAELIISAISTNEIASSSAISSSFDDADRERGDQHGDRDQRSGCACSAACGARGSSPSNAKLKLSSSDGARRRAHRSTRLPLPPSRPVVVAEQVQQPVHERRPPGLADDLRAEDRVAELARQPSAQRVAAVDREREHVGRLVDPEVLALQRADLVRPDEVRGRARRPRRPRPRARARELDGRRSRRPRRRCGSRPRPRPWLAAALRCPSPPRAACTPRRSAARACAGRRPRARSG